MADNTSYEKSQRKQAKRALKLARQEMRRNLRIARRRRDKETSE